MKKEKMVMGGRPPVRKPAKKKSLIFIVLILVALIVGGLVYILKGKPKPTPVESKEKVKKEIQTASIKDTSVKEEPSKEPEPFKEEKPVKDSPDEIVDKPDETATQNFYTVKEGNCLWQIARDIYGDPFKWIEIYNANKDKIEDPDFIHPGQLLTIPRLKKS